MGDGIARNVAIPEPGHQVSEPPCRSQDYQHGGSSNPETFSRRSSKRWSRSKPRLVGEGVLGVSKRKKKKTKKKKQQQQQQQQHEVDRSSDEAVPALNVSYVPGELVDGISNDPIAAISYSNVTRSTLDDPSRQTLGLPASEQVFHTSLGETGSTPVTTSILTQCKPLGDALPQPTCVSFADRYLDDRRVCTDVTSPVTSRRAAGVSCYSMDAAPVTPDCRTEEDVLIRPVSSGLVSRYKNLYEAGASSTLEAVKKESIVSPSSDATRIPIRHLKDDSSPFNQNLQFLKDNLHFTKSTGAMATPPDSFKRNVASRKPKRINEKKGSTLAQGVLQMFVKMSAATSSENVSSSTDPQANSEKVKPSKSKRLIKIRKRSSGGNGNTSPDDDGYSTVEEDKVEKLPKGRIDYGTVPDDSDDTMKTSEQSKTRTYPYATRDVIQDLVDLEPLADLRSYDFVNRNLPKRTNSGSSQGTPGVGSANAALASVLSPSLVGGGSSCMLRRSTLSASSIRSPLSATHPHRGSITSATSEEHYTEIHAALQGIIKTDDHEGPRPSTAADVVSRSYGKGFQKVDAKSTCPKAAGGLVSGSDGRNPPNAAGYCPVDASSSSSGSSRGREGAVALEPGTRVESSDGVVSSGPEGEVTESSTTRRSQRSASKARNTVARNFDKQVYSRIAAGPLSDEKRTKEMNFVQKISLTLRGGKDKENRSSSHERGVLFHRGSVLGGSGRGGWGKDTIMAHADGTVPYLVKSTTVAIRRPGNPSHVSGDMRQQSLECRRYSDKPSSPAAERSYSVETEANIRLPITAADEKIDEVRIPFTTFGFDSWIKNAPLPPANSTPLVSMTKQLPHDVSSLIDKNAPSVSQGNTAQIYLNPTKNAWKVHSLDAASHHARTISCASSQRLDTGDASEARDDSDCDLEESSVYYDPYERAASSNYCGRAPGGSPMTTFGRERVLAKTPSNTLDSTALYDGNLAQAVVPPLKTLPDASFYAAQGDEDGSDTVASLPKGAVKKKSAISRDTRKTARSFSSASSYRSPLCLPARSQDLASTSSTISNKVGPGEELVEMPGYARPRPPLVIGHDSIKRRSSSASGSGRKKTSERNKKDNYELISDSRLEEWTGEERLCWW